MNFFLFVLVSLAYANPETLQRLYQVPDGAAAPLSGSQNIHGPTHDHSLDHAHSFDHAHLNDASSQDKNENIQSNQANVDSNRQTSASEQINGLGRSGSGASFGRNFGVPSPSVITVTQDVTEHLFTTLTNIYYNTVPVTLTQVLKSTATAPSFKVVTTPVDDKVYVSTIPVTKTETSTVTDTSTAHRFSTEVSTDLYTVTHRVYDIRQQIVNSTVVQTRTHRPTIVSTRIDTERLTETVVQTVTNTVVVDVGNQVPFTAAAFSSGSLNHIDPLHAEHGHANGFVGSNQIPLLPGFQPVQQPQFGLHAGQPFPGQQLPVEFNVPVGPEEQELLREQLRQQGQVFDSRNVYQNKHLHGY